MHSSMDCCYDAEALARLGLRAQHQIAAWRHDQGMDGAAAAMLMEACYDDDDDDWW